MRDPPIVAELVEMGSRLLACAIHPDLLPVSIETLAPRMRGDPPCLYFDLQRRESTRMRGDPPIDEFNERPAVVYPHARDPPVGHLGTGGIHVYPACAGIHPNK